MNAEVETRFGAKMRTKRAYHRDSASKMIGVCGDPLFLSRLS